MTTPTQEGLTNTTVVELETDANGVVYVLVRNDKLIMDGGGDHITYALYQSTNEGESWELMDKGLGGDLLVSDRAGKIITSQYEQWTFPGDIRTWKNPILIDKNGLSERIGQGYNSIEVDF